MSPRRRITGATPQVHVFIDEEPPAELLARARAGEIIVAWGNGPQDLQRWADALDKYGDHLIRQAAESLSSAELAPTALGALQGPTTPETNAKPQGEGGAAAARRGGD